MAWMSIEHGKAAYRADFVVYGLVVVALAGTLAWSVPSGQALRMALLVLAGWLGWSAVEYVLHRFILHGLQPFQAWHAEHHARPTARLGVPTLLSAALFGGFFFLPAWALGTPWAACALTLGLTAGYFWYSVVHHGLHHWRSDNAWLRRRKRWHALHHRPVQQADCFGVTTAFWDHALGTLRPAGFLPDFPRNSP